MQLTESLQELAVQNYYGSAFLLAYGCTWLVVGVLWRLLSPKNAALATLFQGMVAFPIALGLSVALGTPFGESRPVEESITQLSIYIGSSQILGLPLLIYLYVRKEFTLMPYAFATICAMHFMLYSWLYQTPFYIIMAVVIAVGGLIVMLATREKVKSDVKVAALISWFTGGAMLLTSGIFWLIRL